MKKLLNSIIIIEIILIAVSILYIGSITKVLNQAGKQALAFSSQVGLTSFEIQNTKPQTSAPATTQETPKTTSDNVTVQTQPAQTTTQTELQSEAKPDLTPAPKPQPVDPAETINLSYSHVVIPAVGIDAPITWNVDGRDMNQYLPVLTHSIAHYDWTALPGQGGSTTLFGHSSYGQNLPNNFDEIFAPLFNMKNGDKVYVVYNNKLFTYEVYQSQTIVPTNPEFISQNGPERVMLMTCAPLGSQKYRLLVYAQRT